MSKEFPLMIQSHLQMYNVSMYAQSVMSRNLTKGRGTALDAMRNWIELLNTQRIA